MLFSKIGLDMIDMHHQTRMLEICDWDEEVLNEKFDIMCKKINNYFNKHRSFDPKKLKDHIMSDGLIKEELANELLSLMKKYYETGAYNNAIEYEA